MSQHKTNSPTNCTDWVTPRHILDALGSFDLDPCCPADMPWRTAEHMVHVPDDGLVTEWHGRVWVNPPYGAEQDRWLDRLMQHGNGIALIPNATETDRFSEYVWGKAHGVCFVHKRIKFFRPDGTLPKSTINQGCCLVAYGVANLQALHECGLGAVVVAVTIPHQGKGAVR